MNLYDLQDAIINHIKTVNGINLIAIGLYMGVISDKHIDPLIKQAEKLEFARKFVKEHFGLE